MRPPGSRTQRITIDGVTRSLSGWLRAYAITWRRGHELLAAGHTLAEIIAMEHPRRLTRTPRERMRRRTLLAAEARITRLVARRVAACERAMAALQAACAEADAVVAQLAQTPARRRVCCVCEAPLGRGAQRYCGVVCRQERAAERRAAERRDERASGRGAEGGGEERGAERRAAA